jgi:DNA ligase-1
MRSGEAPPAIGATVTYRFRDLTGSGLPRFASFLRIRTD